MSSWSKGVSVIAIGIGYLFLCLLAFHIGMSSAKTPPLEFPEVTPYTTQAHYSIHATKTKDGIRVEGFCGEYIATPEGQNEPHEPEMHSDEARDYQIVQMINEITDQTCAEKP